MNRLLRTKWQKFTKWIGMSDCLLITLTYKFCIKPNVSYFSLSAKIRESKSLRTDQLIQYGCLLNKNLVK